MVDNSRRTFRGRGRPTDGNIPHSISQRRRARAARQAHDSLGSRDGDDSSPVHDTATAAAAAALTPAAGGPIHDGVLLDGDASEGQQEELPSSETRADASTSDDDIPPDPRDEIRHLRRRIRNVQESIQLSHAIVHPSSWEQNCLNAVSNCVNEWRSIISFHATTKEGMRGGDDDNEHVRSESIDEEATLAVLNPELEISRSTSLEIFGLVQLAMQSGPLTGGKPGYFKRCGAEVAKLALAFLQSDPLGGDLVEDLWFTEKQAGAVMKWIGNAEKAVANDKPPSKSIVKLQHSQVKEGGKGSRKMKGGSRKGGKKS